MMSVEFVDNRIKVKEKIEEALIAWLHEAAGEMTSQVQRNTAVDTGQLKSSWRYDVADYKYEATIGSPLQNAIWEEFGTGEYALHGDGRKTPWRYKDRKGKWHTTRGKRARRPFYRAYNTNRKKIILSLQKRMKKL